MEKKVAIIQSNYIPWKGYFDLINMADEFVLLDDVQYTRRDWRNRNYIKTPAGLKLLTIPVKVKGNYNAPINQIEVANPDWGRQHWNLLKQFYAKAPYFELYAQNLEALYLQPESPFLSQINYAFLTEINRALQINTPISWSTDFEIKGEKSARLLSICKSVGASVYISGPAAKSYLNEALFAKEGIRVEWMDYSGYREYGQLYPPFNHQVTVLDLLFSEGPEAKKYLKSYSA